MNPASILAQLAKRGYVPDLQRERLYLKPWPPSPAVRAWAHDHRRQILNELLRIPKGEDLKRWPLARLTALNDALHGYLRFSGDEDKSRFNSDWIRISEEIERREPTPKRQAKGTYYDE